MTRRQLGQVAQVLLLLAVLVAAPRLFARYHETAFGRVWRHCPATGHWYTLLRENLTWDEADAMASRYGGYLACVGDEAEQLWLQSTLLNRDFTGAFIGLHRDEGGDTWRWVSGEPLAYTHWCPTDSSHDPALPPWHTAAFIWGAGHTNAFYWDPMDPGSQVILCAVVERERPPASPFSPWFASAAALGLVALLLAGNLAGAWLGPPGGRRWGGRLRRRETPLTRQRRTIPRWLPWLVAALLVPAGGWLILAPGVAPVGVWVERAETGHWYRLDPCGLEWDEAEARAAQLGAQLAAIETRRENEWVVERILNRPLYAAWLGTAERGPEGRFVNPDGSLTGYRNWAPDDPRAELGPPLRRVLIHGRWGVTSNFLGKWAARVAKPWVLPPDFTDLVSHALLERQDRPPPSQRPRWLLGWCCLLLALLLASSLRQPLRPLLRRYPWMPLALLAGGAAAGASWLSLVRPEATQYDWRLNPTTGHWYTLATQRDGWDDAAEDAARAGAELVIVDDQAEQDWLVEQYLQIDTFGAYIGLWEVGYEGNWRWVDGRSADFTAWAGPNPDNDSHQAADVGMIWGRGSIFGQTWNDVPRDPALLSENRPEFAIFERATDPFLAARRTRTAGALLAILAVTLAFAAWRTRRRRGSLEALGATLLAVLVLVGLQPDPPGHAPRTTPPDAPPAVRPPDWPAELADWQPPAPLTWADVRVSPVDGMPQARVPAGPVFWGSPEGEGELDERFRSWRAVSEFWVDLHEVTWAQYAALLNDLRPNGTRRRRWVLLAGEEPAETVSPSRLRRNEGRFELTEPQYGRHPVVWVSREGARTYAWWAGRRLPTEAEWERACRGESVNQRFVWGNQEPPPPEAGNLGGAGPTAVGGSRPNRFGIYDLAGNVSEWCEDRYAPDLLGWEVWTDPVGRLPSEQGVRRGGGFADSVTDQRIARRIAVPETWRGGDTGFRCVSFQPPATQPDRRAALPPDNWPAWLEARRYQPPVLLNWRAFRVASSDGMPQVRIPRGRFQMGSGDRELQRAQEQLTPTAQLMAGAQLPDLEPPHEVTVSAFWIDLHEVTVGQYAAWCRATGRPPPTATDPRLPIAGVSWQEAHDYAIWVGRELPTEAQWERAARGGLDGWLFPWGNDWSPARAGRLAGTIQPIARRAPNGFGLYDLMGNVSEWCRDTFAADAYRRVPPVDPVFAEPSVTRPHRGGSVHSPPLALRCGARAWAGAEERRPEIGFRTVAAK